jgi:hypothetical protein
MGSKRVNQASYTEVVTLIFMLCVAATATLVSLYGHVWLIAILSTVVFMGVYRKLVDFKYFNEAPELRWILAKKDMCDRSTRSEHSRFYFFSWFPMATMCAGWLIWYILVFEMLPNSFFLAVLTAGSLGFLYKECMGPNVKVMMRHQDALEKPVIAMQIVGTGIIAGLLFAVVQSFLPYLFGNINHQ